MAPIPPRRLPRDRFVFGPAQPLGAPPEDHTHVEADITDLQAYLVSPLTTDGDVLFFNSGHQRLAKGADTEVLTLAAGVPTWAAAGGGVTDHGALTGLGDDDHTQYLLKTGGTLSGNLTLGAGAALQINDAGDTDFAVWSHDGTDFKLAFTNTADYNMLGMGQVGMNAEANVTTFLELGEPTTTRGDAQGSKLVMWGENASSVLTKFIFFASGGNFGLSSSGTGALQLTVNLEVNSGKYLRVRDTGGTDWGQWTHDGTDFSLVCVNTSNYRFSGMDHLRVNANMRITGGHEIRLNDSTDADSGVWTHDGTDFNLALTNTTDYNITGLTAAFKLNSSSAIRCDVASEGVGTAGGTAMFTGSRAGNGSSGVDFLKTRILGDTNNPTLIISGQETQNAILINATGSAGVRRLTFSVDSIQKAHLRAAGLSLVNGLGVHGTTASATKPKITGSRGGNAALASLLTALENTGLLEDNTT